MKDEKRTRNTVKEGFVRKTIYVPDEVFASIAAAAKAGFRDPEQQILLILNGWHESQKGKPAGVIPGR